MSTRTKSQAAQVAAIIKKHLKLHGIDCRAKSSNYAGGCSVSINVVDIMPATRELIEGYISQFKHGKFDGMTDMYEFTNRRNDIPQVDYVFLNVEYSDELKQQAWDYAKNYWSGFEGAPESFKDAGKFYNKSINEYGDREMYKFLSGYYGRESFWRTLKPRLTIQPDVKLVEAVETIEAVEAVEVVEAVEAVEAVEVVKVIETQQKQPRLKVGEIREAIDFANWQINDLAGYTSLEYAESDVEAQLTPSIKALSSMLERAPARFQDEITKTIERLQQKIAHWQTKKAEPLPSTIGRGEVYSVLVKNGFTPDQARDMRDTIKPNSVKDWRPESVTTVNIDTGETTFKAGERVVSINSYDLQRLLAMKPAANSIH